MDSLLLARSLAGLAAVLGLLAAALWFVRRFDLALPGRVGGARKARIGIVERVTVDAKRALLLVRQDGREHLLLLAPEGNLVVSGTASSAPEHCGAVPLPALPVRPALPRPMHDPSPLRLPYGDPPRPLHVRAEWEDFVDRIALAKTDA